MTVARDQKESDKRPVVLVADDDADIRSLVTLELTWSGYDVIEAADGAEALERALEHRPDVAVLDISMPGRNGYEVMRELQRTPGCTSIPIVLLSAHAEESETNRRLRGEQYAHVTKPFAFDELRARIAEQLTRRIDVAAPDQRPSDRLPLAGASIAIAAAPETAGLVTDRAQALGATVAAAEDVGKAVSEALMSAKPLAAVVVEVPLRDAHPTRVAQIVAVRAPGAPIIYVSRFAHSALAATGVVEADAHVLRFPFEAADLLAATTSSDSGDR